MKLFLSGFSNKRLGTKLLILLILLVAINVVVIHHFLDFVHTITTMWRTAPIRIRENGTKYILVWNFHYLIYYGDKKIFPTLNCTEKKCDFTKDRDYFNGDLTKFDAIALSDADLILHDRPKNRLSSQIYIFTTIESSYNVPACELFNDDYYNWTNTYRIDSTIPFRYFRVTNKSGGFIAPSYSPQWEVSTEPPAPHITDILKQKTKAAAWFVSNCESESFRDEFLTELQEHLYHFALRIDVFGSCNKRMCDNNDCEEMITNKYLFYMAFENTIAEDYVTEKVLHGYNNFAVPVVYGGANYTRFLPPGSYINAREIHPYHLAYLISTAVKDPTILLPYFNYTNIYKIETAWTAGGGIKTLKNTATHPLCDLCEALHKRVKPVPAIKNFRIWWNGLSGMKWCLSPEYWREYAKVSIDVKQIWDLY